MRFFSVAIGIAFMLSACGGSPAAVESVTTPHTVQGGMPIFTDYDSALSYVQRAMQKAQSHIVFRTPHNGLQMAERLAQDSVKGALVTKVSVMTLGGVVTLTPQYVDDCLLLAVHRGDLPESQLSFTQRNALHKIQGVVRDIRRQYATQYEQALAMHDYILCTSSYDSTMTTWNHATVTVDLINTHRSVCDGYTRLLHMMLSMGDIENCIVIGSSEKDVAHSWNLARLDGEWTHIDCTYDDPVPDEQERVFRHYFGMSDARIAVNHRWKREDYPKAISEKLYYPVTRGLRFDTVADMLRYSVSHAAAGHKNICAYVRELDNTTVNAKTSIEQQQIKLRLNVVKSMQYDKNTPGIVYCHFR